MHTYIYTYIHIQIYLGIHIYTPAGTHVARGAEYWKAVSSVVPNLHIPTYIRRMRIYICQCKYIYMYRTAVSSVATNRHIPQHQIFTYPHIYDACVHTHIYIYVHIYVYIYICIYIYIYIYICIEQPFHSEQQIFTFCSTKSCEVLDACACDMSRI